MKTTAKYILSLRRLAAEAFAPTSNYHAITKDLLSDFNVTESEINPLINKYNSFNISELEKSANRLNLVIDVMDFTKFKQDVLMWRKVVNILDLWIEELKDGSKSIEFKTKQELEN